jgi:putative phosphoribosyl transferase
MRPGSAAAGEGMSVVIPVGDASLVGDLVIPPGATGIVLFAHGSGSGRHSPRNRFVAQVLQEARLATMLVDLLTEEEEVVDARTAQLRFDIALLARRLETVSDWLRHERRTADLRLGYFGASTGAAAALAAAGERPGDVAAIVSRGGRPDLAADALERVRAPTLLIVGGNDPLVLEVNRLALDRLPGEKRLVVVQGASHLFEEPGALEQVAVLARDWFARYLTSAPRS